ncbi:MAG: octaprenyl-diphosphate synthase [Elusimicrobia bacterium]|nr:MAG: octaprenyl-diphosphate synthase [Elusimicrobiota bacterium]KAF0153459.1 MAG: octaprenyl-diphosphate synthase [Elusimicrobiota bacterium]
MESAAAGTTGSITRIEEELSRVAAGINPRLYGEGRPPLDGLGKASRSRFALLLSDALGGGRAGAERVAVCAELAHTASLLHDDCVDLSALRRGRPTLNERLGLNAGILMGDLVVSLALEEAWKISPHTARSLVEAVGKMVQGALLEERARHRRIGRDEFLEIISLKTGELFRWTAVETCGRAGTPALLETCARVGSLAGSAFQVADDVLDFESDPSFSGKDSLKDISEGKATLPVILALEDGAVSGEVSALLDALAAAPPGDLEPALRLAALLRERGFTAAAREKALAMIAETFPLIDTLPVRDAGADLKNFLLTLVHRNA